ncbi:MAG: acetyltransferase [Acidobacteria bacterium]|nr:acetyltransferase [Acidobacteriota bacterium]
MSPEVLLTTERLVLRPLTLDDAPDVQRFASAYEIAANTLSIPHPYPPGAAEEWIRTREEEAFAIALREGDFVGTIGLRLKIHDDRGELGYWIGMPYWRRGYASEAARAMMEYGFGTLHLNKITAAHFGRNPASGRVLQKLGMQYEGTRRQHHKKWDEYVDVVMYSTLRDEWKGLRTED